MLHLTSNHSRLSYHQCVCAAVCHPSSKVIPPLSVFQFDVRSGCPGCKMLQPLRHHDHFLLPVDHLCCRGGGYRHGVHHPPRWSCTEGGLWGQQEANDQLCWRSAGSDPVRESNRSPRRWEVCEGNNIQTFKSYELYWCKHCMTDRKQADDTSLTFIQK